ncbi:MULTISPECIES: hypothetical protein [Streptomyces]|uniref:Uncharacterized protein n=1 Tax=Streptomyces chilikensis TaxID=1194079 RepID=A0ABV3EZN4_9ACTN|nr:MULTISPECIES: hypothetical protein [Streptomyces]MDH6224838.1 hypothetical protein [Streptomyces sp. MJP52]
MNSLKKAKGFKQSRTGTYLSIATTAFGAVTVVKQIRKARTESDTLRLLDAAVSGVAIVTGIALLLRDLKQLGDDDVLLG